MLWFNFFQKVYLVSLRVVCFSTLVSFVSEHGLCPCTPQTFEKVWSKLYISSHQGYFKTHKKSPLRNSPTGTNIMPWYHPYSVYKANTLPALNGACRQSLLNEKSSFSPAAQKGTSHKLLHRYAFSHGHTLSVWENHVLLFFISAF